MRFQEGGVFLLRKSDPGQNPWKYAGLASAIGMNLVVCILAGYFGGSAIANRTDQRAWTAAGVLLGLFIGLGSIVLMIKRIVEETNE
jgi:ATP synthase protein I